MKKTRTGVALAAALFFALAVAPCAAAQDIPFRLGMTAAEASSAAPDARWRRQDYGPSLQAWSSGPPMTIGGMEFFSSTLQFKDGVLKQIDILGAWRDAPADCLARGARFIPVFMTMFSGTLNTDYMAQDVASSLERLSRVYRDVTARQLQFQGGSVPYLSWWTPDPMDADDQIRTQHAYVRLAGTSERIASLEIESTDTAPTAMERQGRDTGCAFTLSIAVPNWTQS